MNLFLSFGKNAKEDIGAHLKQRVAALLQRYGQYGRWTEDALRRINTYSAHGKMLRGALVLLAAKGYGNGTVPPPVLDIAVALELLQSFLLIHDDVMDCDMTRRGELSMHAQYMILNTHAAEEATRIHYGNAMAICCGDIAFALASLQLNRALRDLSHLSLETHAEIVELYYSEVVRVGGAQMDDITFSSIEENEPTPEDVLRLYRSKTGYYSMVLPLQLGALVFDKRRELPLLEKIGCLLGEVFQVRDDLLGLDESVDGEKAVRSMASDMVNRKRTYVRQLLIRQGDGSDLRELQRLEADEMDERERTTRYFRLLTQSGVMAHVEKWLSSSTHTVSELIDTLEDFRAAEAEILRQFSVYNLQRRA